MKKWIIYLLGVITGILMTYLLAFYPKLYNIHDITELGIFGEQSVENCQDSAKAEVAEETVVEQTVVKKKEEGKTHSNKQGNCVSRKDFEVQKVLDNGDAIAREIIDSYQGIVLTSELEVLIPANEAGGNFYNNQVVKAPKGTCARQTGTYRYKPYGEYGETKIIPIIAFE